MSAAISSPARNVLATLCSLISAVVLTGCGSSSPNPIVRPPVEEPSTSIGTLSTIYVLSSEVPAIPVGGTLNQVATGEYRSDTNVFTYKDVTQSAVWSTSDSSVATVSKGVVQGHAIGSATITVSLEGKTASAVVVVGQTAATVTVKSNPSDEFTLSDPYTWFDLIAAYPDGTELNLAAYATWTSSDVDVLKFNNDGFSGPYEATLLSTGTTTITATLATGEVGTLDVTVAP